MTQDTAYADVERLVKKFKALPAAQRRAYNEDNTRKDFILPLFRALEWDIDNAAEVSAEEKVSRGWVDYAFRLGGVPRFFLETKRIAEDLSRQQWVKQAIDYAWTKSVTWALLSDFEGLRVFNAEWKEDNPLRAQFIDFSVDTYLSEFERLWWLSKPEMARGTLDREAERVGKKAKRQPVSQHLFDDLKVWRRELFRHLRQYNPMWQAHIDEAVLRILNRLIFIRAAEDRLVEPPRLLPLLRELRDQGKIGQLLAELKKLFREFDAVYNSELFAAHVADELDSDPGPFETIIDGLYGKHFLLYNFNAIDADVLGTAYEQYLGHVIAEPSSALSPGPEAAEVVEKRAKRKSQGIYYTPTFVVKYIVQQTLGRYLDEHGYNPARPVRVLDMACGSGSFLIEAFDALDRHVAQRRVQTRGSQEDIHDYARRMELLTRCIYGVDKDEQAVAVAQLNLLLKALHTRERLPMLTNIREGNSLISGTPDELKAAFGDEWKAKKAFDWQEQFPEVFPPSPNTGRGTGGEGGFDVIVGNPPYVRIQTLPKDEVAFFNERYAAATGNYDIYVLFVERALQLLRPGGVMGLILPSKFFNTSYGQGLRQLLTSVKALWKIVDFGDAQVFYEATTYTCLLFLKKQANDQFMYVKADEWLNAQTSTPVAMPEDLQEHRIKTTTLSDSEWNFLVGHGAELLERLTVMPVKLKDVAEKLFQGLVTSADQVYFLEARPGSTKRMVAVYSHATNKTYRLEREVVVPLLKGSLDMRRYRVEPITRYVIFPYEEGKLIPAKVFARRFPNCWAYLEENRKALTARERGKMDHVGWYGYVYPKSLTLFRRSKVLTPSIANKASFSYDEHGEFFFAGSGGGGGGGYGVLLQPIRESPLFVLGLFNSRLLDFYLKSISSPFQRGYYAYNKQYIERLPIRLIDFDDPADKKRHDAIVKKVEEMLQLQKEHAEAERNLDDRRHALQRRIAQVDAAIDRMVYELYGLTEEEIAVVEGAQVAPDRERSG